MLIYIVLLYNDEIMYREICFYYPTCDSTVLLTGCWKVQFYFEVHVLAQKAINALLWTLSINRNVYQSATAAVGNAFRWKEQGR